MPKMDGREALREIKADPALRRIPIVVMTTSKAEEDIYRTYDLGVNSFITKPVTFDGLVTVMRALGAYWIEIVELPDVDRSRERRPMNPSRLNILLVDDDEDDYFLTRAVLNEVYGDQVEVEWVSSYEPAKEAMLSGRHGLCLLDYHLGARNGLELLREAMAQGCRTPIILLTGNDDWDVDVEAMEAGAADYLVKGQFGPRLLERSIRYAMGFAVERQQTLEALERSEERYALAVRGANDGLWDWDLTTDRIYFAPRWKSMLGYEEGQIGDSPQEWFGRVHKLDLERVKAEVAAHLAGQSSHLETEHRMLHDDGTYRWVLTRGLAVRDDQGKAVRMAGSQSDITQRKAAEDRLQHDAFHDSLTGLPNRALAPGPAGPGRRADEAAGGFSVRGPLSRHRRLQVRQRQPGSPDGRSTADRDQPEAGGLSSARETRWPDSGETSSSS